MKAYCGYIQNDSLLRQSASGGLATCMAQTTMKSGGICYGVSYTEDFKGAKYIRVTDEAGILKLQSSKYIKAKMTREILTSIGEDLNSGKQVLVIGLPCEIGMVKGFLEKEGIPSDNLLTADLICHGPTDPKVAETYIDFLEKKYGSKIVKFSVRYKNPNWTPGYLFAEFENGKRFLKKFFDTDYGTAFSMMPLEQCFHCAFKGDNHRADITVGDYWGVDPSEDGYHKVGTSLALTHNEKAEAFLKELDGFTLCPADLEKALRVNKRYHESIKKTKQREQFIKNYKQFGLKKAVAKHLGWKGRLKRALPESLLKSVRNIKKR